MPITKIDLADIINKNTELTKPEALAAVESILEIMKEELASGQPVMISGFGRWAVMSKKERIGRNPQTGDPMMITPRKVVTFHSSPMLRKAVNGEELV